MMPAQKARERLTGRATTRRRRRALLAVVLGIVVTGMAANVAAAAGPAWRITSLANTTVAPGGSTNFLIQIRNVGDATLDGRSSEMHLTAVLPTGMSATSLDVVAPRSSGWTCFGTAFPATTVRCRNPSGTLVPPESVKLRMAVTASAALVPGTVRTIRFSVDGGGGAAQSTVAFTTVTGDAPGFGVATIDGEIAGDAVGTPFTQAGGHPYSAAVSFDLNTFRSSEPAIGEITPVEPVRDVYVDLPPGLVGDPTGAEQCTAPQLANTVGLDALPLCPPESQVGTAIIRLNGTGLLGYELGPLPVFNMVPPSNAPARFGFNVLGSVVALDAKVRSGSDYGVTIAVANTPEAIPLAGTSVSLWGDPASPDHDFERACPGRKEPAFSGETCRSRATEHPFIRMPTSCEPAAGSGVDDGLVTAIHVDSWSHAGSLRLDGLPDLSDPDWKTTGFVSHLPPSYPNPPGDWGPHQLPTGCDSVPFDPTLSGQPAGDAKPGQPAAFSFDLTLQQPADVLLPGEADLRRAAVTLPAGVRVSPSSANGLAACSSAQIGLHDGIDPTCPDASKIGTVTVETPLLPRPLDGAVYLAAQGDNPFGSLLAIYIVAHGPGVVLKLPGHVQADPVTGQLSTTFDDNPQLPFSRLHLEFDGGPHAPLTLPDRCGPYTTTATLTSWSGRTVPYDSQFTVNGNAEECSGGTTFAPDLAAGTEDPVAGADSTFNLRLTRSDRDQELKALKVDMPPGLTGRIANVDLCGEAQASDGTCVEGARIGSVTVGAGAGTDPLYITSGRAYLTGPYKGAPFGLSIVVPAKAGPFDLGNVVVRSALFVDRHDASVSVVSDPLPTILEGIPLDVRDVRVSIDRQHFFVNPTSCAEKTIDGTIDATGGASAHVTSRFQVGRCGRLAFHPRLVLAVGSRGHTAKGASTPLSTTLTMPRGNANLSSVTVALPSTINARLTVITDACTREEFDTDIRKCAHARAGTARAVTPLLRTPLRGNVYFVKNGHPIPDLFAALRGQVSFDLPGRIDVLRNRYLTTTFDTAPDVPISSFSLKLFGDTRNGSVGSTVNLCSRRGRTDPVQVTYRAHNGKVVERSQRLIVRGCPKSRRHGGHRRGR